MSGDGERVSRPNSLILEACPEREPLKFDVQLVGAPPEVEQLVNNIKQVAEDFLYHWKTFPIVLPQSRFTGPGNRPSDIIIAPPCDEIDLAFLDNGVESQPLSPKQLHSIRERGEFEVPSRHFPGQTQVWRVASWLQRGRMRLRKDLYTFVARAAALIIVVARDRLLRDEPFSVMAGGRSVLMGLRRLLDLLIGMPSMEARDLEKKLREERSRYLVAELICKPEFQDDIACLAAWLRRAMRRAAADKGALRGLPPRAPVIYTTPQKTDVDLSLYRRELLRRAAPTLQTILETESRGWFLHFRERKAALLASQKMPMKDIEEEVRDAAMSEYVSRVCNAVLASEQLRSLGEEVPELLANQLRASVIVNRAEEGVQKKLETGLAAAEARICASHPILSHSEAWKNEKLSIAAQRLRSELKWTSKEDAANAMLAHKLFQHRYFLMRDLAFLRDREPLLMKELRAAKTPTREFTWTRRIWLPHNWIVTRHFRGRSEKIPTVLSTRETSIVTPRSDPSQPVFLVQREKVTVSATRWIGWRLCNLRHRTWCWGWNMMFVLGLVVAWSSPVGLRALIQTAPYVSDLELSQVNGTLFPKRSSETQTIWSRLLLLWRYVSKERTRFETEPDTGLLGKGMSRQANRLLNYVIIGGLGSVMLLLIFPLVVIIVSVLSVFLSLSVPLWMPVLSLTVHALCALVYDVDCPSEKLNRWFPFFEVLIWRILVLGLLQSLAALIVATILCPVSAFLLLVGGGLWWVAASVWERGWWTLLVRAARTPHRDCIYCKRVPRTKEQQICFVPTCAQATAAVCARGELELLSHWAAEMETAIERPLKDYAHFVDACFGPFSVQIAKTGAYKQLEKECSELTSSLRDKVSARRRELALNFTEELKDRVRMSAEDLRSTVESSALALSRMWSAHAHRPEWWSRLGLEPRDYHALAANLLVEVFDSNIMVPLSREEPTVPLEGSGAGPVPSGDLPAPDVLRGQTESWSEWGRVPRVHRPSLELVAFSPRAPPQPPLASPRSVALVTHNRESDNPLPLDSELVAEILKKLDESPECDDKRDYVERYRGGGSDAGTSEESDYTPHDEQLLDDTSDTRIPPSTERAACRWTLTGRGVRLRADLASPEDVTLDTDRHVGTSV